MLTGYVLCVPLKTKTAEEVIQAYIDNVYSKFGGSLKMRNSIFSGTEPLFPGTQAFASPSDMASSGVWGNIKLSKTPTFDGVCGMFLSIFC